MTFISVWYDPDCDQIWITDEGQSYARRSLVAGTIGGSITIALKNDLDDLIINTPWANIVDANGNGFTDQATVLAYLQGEFAKRRPVGETFGIPVVAGADLTQGQPVAVSRASGQLLPARADTYPLSFVAGLASADTAQGFTNQPAHGAVTLDDWSGIAGASSLFVGQPYFLNASGGLTATPRLDTICVARIGLATAPQTLVVEPSTPILL